MKPSPGLQTPLFNTLLIGCFYRYNSGHSHYSESYTKVNISSSVNIYALALTSSLQNTTFNHTPLVPDFLWLPSPSYQLFSATGMVTKLNPYWYMATAFILVFKCYINVLFIECKLPPKQVCTSFWLCIRLCKCAFQKNGGQNENIHDSLIKYSFFFLSHWYQI